MEHLLITHYPNTVAQRIERCNFGSRDIHADSFSVAINISKQNRRFEIWDTAKGWEVVNGTTGQQRATIDVIRE